MHDKGLDWTECEALYSLFQHPGFQVLRQKMEEFIEGPLMQDLRKGGKEAHDQNVGRIRGVEETLRLFGNLKEEAINKAKEG